MIDDAQLVNSLLEQGIVDQATLKKGLEQTEKSERSLYESLILNKLVTEDRLVRLVSGLLNVPAVDPDPADIPSDVRELVPASMARRNRVLPLQLLDGELVLGMVDPIDVLAMDEIATHTGIDIRPVLIGPSTIDEVFEDLYGAATDDSSALADEVLDSFDDFDVQGMMDEVMDDEEWDGLFDDEEHPSVEDSAVLSRDMRDRPSTDVLAEEDVDAAVAEADGEPSSPRDKSDPEEEFDEEDLIEIEIIEELGKPVDIQQKAREYVSLDEWEIDEAIAGPGDSEILTAESAEELFKSEPSGKHAALEDEEAEKAETGTHEASDVLQDTQSSKTTIGVSVDHLEDGALGGEAREAGAETSEVEDQTGRTELGIATRASDSEAEEQTAKEKTKQKTKKKPGSKRRSKRSENTDYGALGRAILKSSPSSSEATDDEETNVREESAAEQTDVHEPDDETNVREASEPDDETDIHEASDTEIRSANGDPDEADERDEPDDAAISLKEREERPTDPEPGLDHRPATDVRTREIDEEALETLTGSEEPPGPSVEEEASQTDIIDPSAVEEDRRGDEPTSSTPEETRPRLNSPQMRLPEGIDVEGLALALANLLIAKDILTLDEIFHLAKSLTPDE